MQKLRSRPRVVKSVASGRLARSRQTAGRRSVSKIGAVLGRRDRTKVTFLCAFAGAEAIEVGQFPHAGGLGRSSQGPLATATSSRGSMGEAVALRNRSRPRSSRVPTRRMTPTCGKGRKNGAGCRDLAKPVGLAGDERQGNGGLAFPGLSAERPQLPVPDMN
jgi:hypothetical protein